MNTSHRMALLSLVALGALHTTNALAEDSSYYYAGVGVGQSRANIEEDRMTNSVVPSLVIANITHDKSDTAYKLYGGYQFNRYFAVEAGYFNLGAYSFTSTTVPTGQLNGRIKVQGVNIDLVGTLPVTDVFSVMARIGAHNSKTSDTFSGSGAAIVLEPNPSKRQTNYKAGLGLQYEINPSFLIRAEVERYRANDALSHHVNIDAVSLSLVFPLGRTSTSGRY